MLISTDNAPQLISKVQRIAGDLSLGQFMDSLAHIVEFKGEATSEGWLGQLHFIEDTMSAMLFKLHETAELGTIAMNALETIQSLYDRNLELLDQCDFRDKEITELKEVNEQLKSCLRSSCTQSDLRTRELESELEEAIRQKLQIQEVYAHKSSSRTEHFGKLLQKEISLREEYEHKFYEEHIQLEQLKQKNYGLEMQVYQLESEARKNRQSYQAITDQEVLESILRVDTMKTLIISEIGSDDEEDEDRDEEKQRDRSQKEEVEQQEDYDSSEQDEDQRRDHENLIQNQKPVSLASQLYDMQNQSQSYKDFLTFEFPDPHLLSQKKHQGLLIRQQSLGRLSTAESDESFKTMRPPSNKNMPKYVGMSHSHYMSVESFEKQGMFDMMKSHLNLQGWSRTCSSISGMFQKESKLGRIHQFLHRNIVDKKLRRFKKKDRKIVL